MPRARNKEIELEFDTVGNPEQPAILMVMGLMAQMINWDVEFCRRLSEYGYFVIRFDNRDCGLSTKTASLPAESRPGSYTLHDMAEDGMAVLDSLGIGGAHVVGASMGGMIGQTMAINYPDRVLSLTSMMSTTGAPDVGMAEPKAIDAMLAPAGRGREAAIERTVRINRVIGGPLFDEQRVRRLAGIAHDRSYYPAGSPLQLAAVMAAGDRTLELSKVDLPCLVIHGDSDSLIHFSGGEATAAAVPGARFVLVEKMGHDLPLACWDQLLEEIAAVCKRAG